MDKHKKHPMTKEDAARIQSSVDKKKPNESNEEFKRRVQRAAEENSKLKK
ncbi:MAG: hypothetical protein IPO06_14620 [Leptospiraceae bacterium]|jgi:hypothetical protein|nr:hypothetical protein [Leptospiraceae bacterium]